MSIKSTEVIIRPMRQDDLPEVITVHLQSFPDFFLTFLGPKFLRLLYQHIMQAEDGIAFVACHYERLDGFVAGVLHQSGFYRQLAQQHQWAFARASLRAVIKKPSIIPRLWRALRRSDETRTAAADACLMSIAVRPESEGQGIGQQLVKAFCRALEQQKAPAVCLTTDHDHNERVNQFYQRLGFQLHQVFTTPEGRVMNEYVIALPMKEDHA